MSFQGFDHLAGKPVSQSVMGMQSNPQAIYNQSLKLKAHSGKVSPKNAASLKRIDES